MVGVDISPDLLEMAEQEAEAQSLEVTFMQADLRELDLHDEFDLVLSLNDGAVGYFETDEENLPHLRGDRSRPCARAAAT